MDMFDFSSIIELAKVEPGHNLIQCILLFMIWFQSRGIRKEMHSLRDALHEAKSEMVQRFEKIENRVTVLEHKGA